jgi:sugar phosphate isomerase/epimerase
MAHLPTFRLSDRKEVDMYLGARAHSLDDVEFLAEAGFDFAEIDWNEPDLVRAQLGELAILRDKYSIDYLAHGPKEGDPFDVDHLTAELSPAVCRLVDLASELGIDVYTQHLWLDARFVSAEVIACKVDLLRIWSERAAQAGVTLCIENLSEHADHFAPAFEQVPALDLTLDLGHGQILAPEPTGNAAFELIARFGDRIRHVHLHDNHGGDHVRDDLHLPIGRGKVDFPGILRALREAGYDGGFSLEVKLEHVERGRELVQDMWGRGGLGK